MVNQDSFTPQEYAKMVGMFPDPPQNPLPTGGYMDAGFDWVVHQAEEGEGQGVIGSLGWSNTRTGSEGYIEYDWAVDSQEEDGWTDEQYEEVVRGVFQDVLNKASRSNMENWKTVPNDLWEGSHQGRNYKIADDGGLLLYIYGKDEDKWERISVLFDFQEGISDLEEISYRNNKQTIYREGWEVHNGYNAETFDPSDDGMMKKEVRLRIDEEGTQFTPTWAIEKKIPVLYHYDDSSDLEGIVEDMGDVAERYAKEHNDAYRFGAEAQPISDEGELLVIRNDMGQTKGFIEMEEDLEDDSIEMEISDDEMEEIAEITLDAEFMAQRKQYPFIEDFGDLYVLDKTAKGNYVVKLRGGNVVGGRVVAELSPMYSQVDESFAKRVVEDLNGNAEQRTADLLNFVGNKTQAGYAQDIGFNRAETATYEPSQEPDMEAPATEPTNANFDAEYEVSIERKMIQHLDGVDIEADSQKELKEKAKEIGYERSDDFVNTKVVGGMDGYSIAHQDLVKESDFVKPSRDWFSLALGTAAVVIGGSLFLQNRGVFKADGDGTETAPSLVAHPSTGDLLPADYEEMVVESTGYAVPVIPVSLDPAFMGSRFHALPTDRTVESNEPGIGAHTDVAMTRDTNYREPEQTMVTEPPFAYKFNAEKKLSLLDRIKAFFMGHKDVKEANSVTGQTPYFGVGFEPKNPQTRVIKETRPISLDPSTAPYLPTNLSGYTGQSYTPPSVYSDMMQIGITGQTPSFVSSQSSIGENRAGSRPVATSDSLQSVHGNLSAGVNQSYTDGSKTMSLSQWSIEYDVSQISDSEAFAVSRSSGERTMIRRV